MPRKKLVPIRDELGQHILIALSCTNTSRSKIAIWGMRPQPQNLALLAMSLLDTHGPFHHTCNEEQSVGYQVLTTA